VPKGCGGTEQNRPNRLEPRVFRARPPVLPLAGAKARDRMMKMRSIPGRHRRTSPRLSALNPVSLSALNPEHLGAPSPTA